MFDVSKNLIGFEDNLSILKYNLINKTLSNSLIFYGNKGIGKKTFSYSLINDFYNQLSNNDSNFNHTNLIYNNSHPNIRVISKEIDDNTKKIRNFITINQIRKLESFIYQSSINNLPNFVIIDSADDLNIYGANALLKVLEEPKTNIYFILISHQLSNLLLTIRSRCVKFKFSNLTPEQFNKIIEKHYEFDNTTTLDFLYDLSNGSAGLALKLYSENINNIFNNIITIFKEKKPLSSDILELSNTVGNYDNDQFKIFLSLIKFILINTMKINLGINIKKIFISNLSKSIYELSQCLDNKIAINILDFLNIYEKNLFIFNLDKKIFSLNIFASLSEA